jgi:methylated-DNA-protein-cysteine methyltransferase-like protein
MKAKQPQSDDPLPRIWSVVKRVPPGKVMTYGDVARAAGPPCTARQIGRALGKAPAGLRLPWHRVLAAGGRIALPGQCGLDQRLRLQAEGVTFSGRRVRMKLHQYRPVSSGRRR